MTRYATISIATAHRGGAMTIGEIFELNDISAGMIGDVGGKAANLGELTSAGFPLPPGFCVTTDAHRRLAATAGLDKIVGAAAGELLASTARARVTDRQVTELAALGDRVETHWGAPQDIEWAIDAGGTLWLTQARPITTLYPLPDPGGRQGCGAISVSASRRACTGRVVVGADPLGAGDGDGRPEFPWRRGRPRVRDTGGGRRSAGHRPIVDR
jgi:phosphoenolpyruvate synthase/pyruvate phosphate dikinase